MFIIVEVRNIKYALCKNLILYFSNKFYRVALVIPVKRKGEEICVFVVYFTKSLHTQSFQNLLQYSVLIIRSCKQKSKLEPIPRALRNHKVHHRLHKNKINLIFALLLYAFNIHFSIIFLNTPRFSKWPLVVRFPHPNLAHNSSLPHSWCNHLNNLVHGLSRSKWNLRNFFYPTG
jgi:hypothetical protein